MPVELPPPRLSESQLDDAAVALSLAPFDDPLQTYMLPGTRDRERLSPPFFQRVLRQGQLFGEVYTTAGTARAAAVWFPPGALDDTATSGRENPLAELPYVVGVDAMGRFDWRHELPRSLAPRDAPDRIGTWA